MVSTTVRMTLQPPPLPKQHDQELKRGTNKNDDGRDPTVYRFPTDTDETDQPQRHTPNQCDYRNVGGPLLSYVWCTSAATESSSILDAVDNDDRNVSIDTTATTITIAANEETQPQPQMHPHLLQGQTLYLGAEISTTDGCMYCIPGHAERVLKIEPQSNQAILVGPKFVGRKYKWLRGVERNGVIYGLPCHADTVLKIDVPNRHISELPIQYEAFFGDGVDKNVQAGQIERHREWKYHGGNISPIDGCIYTIPQSAQYVLRIDPNTDTCQLVPGPKLDRKYQFYGGVVGHADGAIYGIPHNSSQVLRIHPVEGITLHGDFQSVNTNPTEEQHHTGVGVEGAHMWHGGTAAANGVIVCVAANADRVLCITPASPAPILTLIGNDTVVQSGRHRSDRKYKYLGATTGPDGRVYCFPCAAEYVLAVDTVHMTVHQVGPNIYDRNMERLCQNKWQNGVYIPQHNCILGIPLAAESVLHIDFEQLQSNGDPTISTWPIPAPHQNMGKWEGAVVASYKHSSSNNNNNEDGVAAYCIPNNHKASLRIEMPTKQWLQEHNASTASQIQTK